MAILILSPKYFGTDYIWNNELPYLLERQRRGLYLYPIIAEPCLWKSVDGIKDLATRPNRALSDYRPPQRKSVLMGISNEINELLNEGPTTLQMGSSSSPPEPKPNFVRRDELINKILNCLKIQR